MTIGVPLIARRSVRSFAPARTKLKLMSFRIDLACLPINRRLRLQPRFTSFTPMALKIALCPMNIGRLAPLQSLTGRVLRAWVLSRFDLDLVRIGRSQSRVQ